MTSNFYRNYPVKLKAKAEHVKVVQGFIFDDYFLNDEIYDWLEDTFPADSWRIDMVVNIYFKREEDAMLYKLAWC